MRLRGLLLGLLACALPVPALAARVVALAPSVAELVCAAGACQQLVARVDYSDYPERVAMLPSVGNAFSINAEVLLAQRPDLVVIWDGGTAAASLDQLRHLNVDVLPIRIRQLGDVGDALIAIGKRLGTEDAARQAAADYNQRIAALRAQYRDVKRLRVFYQIESDPIFTINRDSPISQALSLCGGDNVFADLPMLAGALGREAVLARDPDVVVWGRQDNSVGIEAFWRSWPQMRATRANNLYAIDADLLARATPRMTQGITQLCAALDQARAKPPLR